MKKILIILFIAGSAISFSQEVKDIVTTQNGDKIDVSFKISDSNSKQIFAVTLFCAIDGKEKVELKSITGDVGKNIPGGKDSYKITWDVLKDVDELNSAEFFVKIEVVNKKEKNDVTNNEKPVDLLDKPFYGGYNMSFILPIGLKYGYLRKWGYFVSARFGSVAYTDNEYYFDRAIFTSPESFASDSADIYDYSSDTSYQNNSFYRTFGYSIDLGISRRIINGENLKLHLYGSVGVGFWCSDGYNNYEDSYYYWNDNPDDSYATYNYYDVEMGSTGHYERIIPYYVDNSISFSLECELGFIIEYKRFIFNMGFVAAYNVDMVLGLGYRF